MNNSCQQTIPGYKNMKNQFMKIRNNPKLSVISKLRHMEKLASSDQYKNFRSAFKTKCPAQYKKSQMMLSKFMTTMKVLKKLELDPKKKEKFNKVIKAFKKLNK